MPLKIANIISLVHKANIFEWVAEELSPEKFSQVFILLHNEETEFERNLRQKGFTVYRVHYRNKKNMPAAVLKMMGILRKEKIQLVHTHLFDAGVGGQFAAWLCRIPKRIHTRHDATVNHDYYPNAVKYDKFTNRLATTVIAISASVKEILLNLEHVPEQKITIIHHGFKLQQFENVEQKDVQELSSHYFPNGKPFPVIGVISRYMHWKGVQFTIDAFAALKRDYPDAHLVLANAGGPYQQELHEKLKQISKESYTEIKFESRIFALYRLFDVFVHVPIDGRSEAFGQIYVEAMASGIPCVVTLSGIARDYIVNDVNACVVPFQNSAAITEAVKKLLGNPELCKKLTAQARKDVDPEFTVTRQIQALEALYLKGNN
ncbi:MAG: glycosyltransferase family 4 protein [Bacteroidia bacterium]